MNSIDVVSPRQPHGVTKPHSSDRAPLVFTVLLHIVVLTVLIWFGKNLAPLPVPKHIQAVIVPSTTMNNTASQAEPKSTPAPSSPPDQPIKQQVEKQQIEKQQLEKQQKAEERQAEKAAEVAAAALAAEKAAALAKQQQKIEYAKAQAAKQAEADKQAEIERAYALKKAQHAEKLKAEVEEKRLAKEKAAEDAKAEKIREMKAAKAAQEKADKEQALKDAKAKEKAEKEQALKDAKAKEKTQKEQALKDAKAKEKAEKEAADKAAKEQAIKDAKAQEKADKLKAAKEAADAKRRLMQSLGNDDAEVSNLKGQVAANAKANSVGKYAAQIKSRIKSAWHVPAGSSGLKATARFTLGSDGSVASVVITHSSGNDDFDASIKALRNLSGIPVPDDSDTFSQVKAPTITFVAP
ncbi:MAG: cell envelope integrity protein TolA [Gammaproteobacteria bacterium]|nr:cell envelope integrity protein TolA [Gammaproteobacteria bacterium]